MLTLLRSLLLLTWGCLGWVGALLLLPFYSHLGAHWHKGVLWVRVTRLVPSWASGQCWGLVTFTTAPEPSERLLRHEDRHSWQWAVLGPLFLPAYGLASLAGYRENWFEKDARAHE